jgi:hypothetical protein
MSGTEHSLPRLLTDHRGACNARRPPPLDPRPILRWAREHFRRTGKWPTCESGPIAEAPGEAWKAVNLALYLRLRGFPGSNSLSRLLDQRRNGSGPRPRSAKAK